MKKVKVLSLGNNQINFIQQLYGGVKSINENILFDIDEFWDFTKGKIDNKSESYDNLYYFSKTKLSFFEKLKTFLIIFFKDYFWQDILLAIQQKTIKIKVLKNILRNNIRNYFIVNNMIKPLNHDVYHFHSMQVNYVKYLKFLPNTKKIICSFWGLDLYHNNSLVHYYNISLALNKADVITVQTIEMKEVVAAKFGKNLKNKIKVITFPLSENILPLIDKSSNDVINKNKFKLKIGIKNLNKPIVTLGYSAHENAQHIDALIELKKLPPIIKKNIIILIPLTYGRNEKYLKKLANVVKSIDDIEIILCHEYLAIEELALLKCISDVTIQVAENDALSSAVLEAMYAGSILIVGGWLPYKIYHTLNIKTIEIITMNVLSEKLLYVLENLEKIQEKIDDKAIIKSTFYSKELLLRWSQIYLQN